ncbi:type II toxin-antitoxin system Phd/YefM family antitoxin [Gluconacetobacter tumulisoli]|uniref:Antitoxin n=1 Tax=Gluconacetobacter tumulisoli TaxID=1286189 RepID=A0A7W4K5R5_9PROT|nr:type II toxin-antitoxin system prevent-host-death family antitoxin [Gluconacetobacter tumulisoli]MBB2200747.1 type II toxin-antitoxin system prevent-host-death family antitoxin [Gluconacetobacter tumulisoli]
MRTVNIHEAKTHLSRLIDEAMKGGEGFVIAKAGRPMVRVVPMTASEPRQTRRLGFLTGYVRVPDDFDRMGGETVGELFEGEA